ncbi:tetratricopeptide repeat protein [Marinobacter halotolerans]|uniref:tetratricopeptide repeat protein n=1 Tax=Marinobacter halotolerans TaxID=1569211 RepID=UPI00177D098A|nr:tetratricopeptide repeat protein [Marinobacter halotolerans]
MKLFPIFVLMAALFLSQGVSADNSPTPQADFQSGVAAFQAGDLDRAKRLLEQARNAGLDSSALRYNLGVVYFRLGLYDKAEAAFSGLLDTPHAPLARYNLGLVLKQKGDLEGARQWFARAADQQSPEQIQTLAQRQLMPSARDAGADSPSVRTVGFLSTAVGYDDNISGAPNSASTGEAGAFGELLASGRGYAHEREGKALRLDAVAYGRRYPGNARFNTNYLSMGATWQQPLTASRLLSGLSLSGFWFGGDLLERQVRLDLAYERPGCFWPTVVMLDCEIETYAAKIQGGSGFSAYDGEVYGGSLVARKSVDAWTLEAAYGLDIDHRRDLQSGDEFFSLSPTRHRVSFEAERQLTNAFSAGIRQTFRASRYADPHRLVESGQTVTETREDEQFRTLLFAGYQLNDRWRLGADLSWLDNQSSLARYEYDQAELLISLDGVF